MCQCYVNGKCKAILWLIIIMFCIRNLSAAPQTPRDTQPKNKGDVNELAERRARQSFPFMNNPGQQIFERIKTNLEKNSNLAFGFQSNANTNLGNLGLPFANNFGFAGQALQNTYGILNKTFENLNQLSMGNFGNSRFTTPRAPYFSTAQPNIHNGGSTLVPDYSSATPNEQERRPSTPSFRGEDNNISHYIDGEFPVILLKPEEVRK